MKKRSIKIGHELIAVNEETYKEYTRWKDRVRYQAQRDGKCGYPSNWRCDGDCGNCRYAQEGYNMISYATAYAVRPKDIPEEDFNPDEMIPYTAVSVENEAINRIMWTELTKKLNALVPDGGSIAVMMRDGYSDRQMVRILKLSSQSTLNYRKRKVKAYLHDHWTEYFD